MEIASFIFSSLLIDFIFFFNSGSCAMRAMSGLMPGGTAPFTEASCAL